MTTRFRSDATAVVLTISDRCSAGTQIDRSGPAVAALLTARGMAEPLRATLPDEVGEIAHALRHYAATADLVITTGGTGLAPRDVTPEATRMVCDRFVEGLSELMRAEGLKQTLMAPLSRGVCGCVDDALIVNLPGSLAGAETSLRAILHLLPHALDLIAGLTSHETDESLSQPGNTPDSQMESNGLAE